MNREPTPEFRAFSPSDIEACLALFDRNTPDFFAPGEREEYAAFLAGGPSGYEVAERDREVCAVYGLSEERARIGRLQWIMVDPSTHGTGVGSAIMRRVIDRARRAGLERVLIAASHLSEPFFERFGAETVGVVEDGWGEGMHRHDMSLSV